MLSTMLAKLRIGPFHWRAIALWRSPRLAVGVLALLVLEKLEMTNLSDSFKYPQSLARVFGT